MNETVTPVHLQSVTQTDGMAAMWLTHHAASL